MFGGSALGLALAAFAAIVTPSLSFSILPSPHMVPRRGCAAPHQVFFCTSSLRSCHHQRKEVRPAGRSAGAVRASVDGAVGGEVTLLKVVFEESSVEVCRLPGPVGLGSFVIEG